MGIKADIQNNAWIWSRKKKKTRKKGKLIMKRVSNFMKVDNKKFLLIFTIIIMNLKPKTLNCTLGW